MCCAKLHFLIITVVILAGGCSTSSTVVHINARYLDENTTDTIVERLAEQDIQAIVNQHRFPDSITKSSVIYSPFLFDEATLSTVQKEIELLGFGQVDMISLTSENHWYTKRTLGVYLLPLGEKANAGELPTDFIDSYYSDGCADVLTLDLDVRDSFILTQTNNVLLEGTWHMTAFPYLLFTTKTPYTSVYFEISEFDFNDQYGTVKRTVLTPQNSSEYFSCPFYRDVRQS